MATNDAPDEQTDEIEEAREVVRQFLINAGGYPETVRALSPTILFINFCLADAGHDVAKLCPPPTPTWDDWREVYGEY